MGIDDDYDVDRDECWEHYDFLRMNRYYEKIYRNKNSAIWLIPKIYDSFQLQLGQLTVTSRITWTTSTVNISGKIYKAKHLN